MADATQLDLVVALVGVEGFEGDLAAGVALGEVDLAEAAAARGGADGVAVEGAVAGLVSIRRTKGGPLDKTEAVRNADGWESGRRTRPFPGEGLLRDRGSGHAVGWTARRAGIGG